MSEAEKKEKKTGGRPKKGDTEKRKHPGWGFTNAERDAITIEFEKSEEQNIGTFIFKKVTNQPLTRSQLFTFPDDLKKDFRALSNNINQIAVSLNSRKHDPLASEMLRKLELIARQFEFLGKRLTEK
jgi:hypothetical protein